MKVFGGMLLRNSKQVRAIVAAKSKKRAAELLDITLYELNMYWSETGNDIELEVALGKPETVFVASTSMGKDFTEA